MAQKYTIYINIYLYAKLSLPNKSPDKNYIFRTNIDKQLIINKLYVKDIPLKNISNIETFIRRVYPELLGKDNADQNNFWYI